jgi:DNA-binding transcriptional ArsR family regulator
MTRRAKRSERRRRDKDGVYYAIADPTRRALLDRLAAGEQPVNDLAERFSITRAAVSQHLAILRGTGLVMASRVGRERHYRLNAKRLEVVYDWVVSYERFWSDKLKALGEHLRRFQ